MQTSLQRDVVPFSLTQPPGFWVAFAFIPTGFVGFFHSGPFAWHGVISFWLAFAVYAGWFIVMTIALRRAINDEIVEQARHV